MPQQCSRCGWRPARAVVWGVCLGTALARRPVGRLAGIMLVWLLVVSVGSDVSEQCVVVHDAILVVQAGRQTHPMTRHPATAAAELYQRTSRQARPDRRADRTGTFRS